MAGTLYITGDAEADGLLNTDGTALLIGMLLDQQVPMEWAFAGPATLRRRLGHLDAPRIAAMDGGRRSSRCAATKPAIHRFPASMGRRIHALCRALVGRLRRHRRAASGRASTDGAELLRPAARAARLRRREGADLRRHPRQADGGATARMARRRPARFGDDDPRSVADITDEASLAEVREWKRAAKAARRDKQDRPLP